MKFELWLPFGLSLRSQKFGENANAFYKDNGLKGHTASDWAVPFGTLIPFCSDDSFVYSLMNKDNPDLSKYRAVYTLVEISPEEVYEISYGHCDQIFAEVGKTYKAGEILGTVGNNGDVYQNGIYVPIADRNLPLHPGSHLHGPQVRACRKVKQTTPGFAYLQDSMGIYRKDGFYYEVKDFWNGYNGCVSDEPFYNSFLALKRDEVISSLLEQKRNLLQKLVDYFRNKFKK